MTRRVEALGIPTPAPAKLSVKELVQKIYDLRNAGRQLEAEPLIAEVLNDPNHKARKDVNFWRALAIWSADAHHHESVRDAYAEIIKFGPTMPQPWDEYSMALVSTGDWSDAWDAMKMGLDFAKIQKLPPHDPTVLSLTITKAGLYMRRGQPSQARTAYLAALEQIEHAPPRSRYMLAQAKLLLTHDAEAWRLHEERLTQVVVYQWDAWHAPKVRRWWPGLKGRVVFWQEQGAGDLLMMLRYVPLIAESSGQGVVVRCDPHLWSVVRQFPGVASVVGREDAVDADFELPILSAPFAFGCKGWSDIPAPICPPSLAWTRPDADDRDRLVIGVCWSGAKGHPNDRDRSMPTERLEHLRERLTNAYVQYQALQPGPVPDWMAPLPVGDYLTTANTIKRCHAVFTVDTSVVHLAATMGVPTACVVPASSEWRWGLGHTAPWYPTLRMIRRPAVNRWNIACIVAGDWIRVAIGRPATHKWWFDKGHHILPEKYEVPYSGEAVEPWKAIHPALKNDNA